jgi:hypothetical protein
MDPFDRAGLAVSLNNQRHRLPFGKQLDHKFTGITDRRLGGLRISLGESTTA